MSNLFWILDDHSFPIEICSVLLCISKIYLPLNVYSICSTARLTTYKGGTHIISIIIVYHLLATLEPITHAILSQEELCPPLRFTYLLTEEVTKP